MSVATKIRDAAIMLIGGVIVYGLLGSLVYHLIFGWPAAPPQPELLTPEQCFDAHPHSYADFMDCVDKNTPDQDQPDSGP
jgi:hypothetical protein